MAEHIDLPLHISRKLGVPKHSFNIEKILRQGLDLRKRNNPIYDYTVLIKFCDIAPHHADLLFFTNPPSPQRPERKLSDPHPFIIGMGPAGLFCALAMVERGLSPYLFDQGDEVGIRAQKVNKFWQEGVLDEGSNVQFGEGGAGAFSDGKLTCRSRDADIEKIFAYLISFGADPQIAYAALPHLGTDGIRAIIARIRDFLVHKGCRFFYGHRFEDLALHHNRIAKISINGDNYEPELLIMALGNSARQSFKLLHTKGFPLAAKPFAVGFRIEHEQDYIDKAIYGSDKWRKILGPASYRLVDKSTGTYSFCMCPGGEVIASSSELGAIVTNGMSFGHRSGKYSNSAIVTAVNNADYGNGILDGMNFQRYHERNAFKDGYLAPIQAAVDFVNNTGNAGPKACTYRPGTYAADLNVFYSFEL
ncbi:MAG: hypothetical protein U1C33_08595 [Candidatus Cloacimonadaceae bacterium]|nr:hypothetical protein [Candidatus Cloacimonadaceae bacterium]